MDIEKIRKQTRINHKKWVKQKKERKIIQKIKSVKK